MNARITDYALLISATVAPDCALNGTSEALEGAIRRMRMRKRSGPRWMYSHDACPGRILSICLLNGTGS